MRRITLYGSGRSTPGVAIPPATLRTDPNDSGDITTGLMVKFNVSAPAAQPAIQLIDKNGTTALWEILQSSLSIYNMKFGSSNSVFVAPACFNATQTPVCVELAAGARIWGGTGVPTTAGNVGTARVGDCFLNRTGGVGAYYSLCTVAGSPGTWTALA